MDLFKRKPKLDVDKLPPILTDQEEPVNFNSVLDYLTGLSDPEYKTMIKATEAYRATNKVVAKLIGVKDEPTTTIAIAKPTDEEIETAMDDTLAGNFIDEAQDTPKPKKRQASTKKVEVKE